MLIGGGEPIINRRGEGPLRNIVLLYYDKHPHLTHMHFLVVAKLAMHSLLCGTVP